MDVGKCDANIFEYGKSSDRANGRNIQGPFQGPFSSGSFRKGTALMLSSASHPFFFSQVPLSPLWSLHSPLCGEKNTSKEDWIERSKAQNHNKNNNNNNHNNHNNNNVQIDLRSIHRPCAKAVTCLLTAIPYLTYPYHTTLPIHQSCTIKIRMMIIIIIIMIIIIIISLIKTHHPNSHYSHPLSILLHSSFRTCAQPDNKQPNPFSFSPWSN